MLFDKGKITFYCGKHNVLTWFVMFYVWFHIKRKFDYLLLNHKSNPFLRTGVVHFVIRLHFIPFCHSFWKSCNLFFSYSMLCIDQVSGKVLRKKIIIVSTFLKYWILFSSISVPYEMYWGSFCKSTHLIQLSTWRVSV